MKFHCPTAVCLLLTASEVLAGISSWDETQLQLLGQYSTPLRWDNVEGPPRWVSGSKPQGHWRRALHLISLAPGQETVIRANPNCWLRLAGEGKTLHAGDFEISISTDTRLFAEAPS